MVAVRCKVRSCNIRSAERQLYQPISEQNSDWLILLGVVVAGHFKNDGKALCMYVAPTTASYLESHPQSVMHLTHPLWGKTILLSCCILPYHLVHCYAAITMKASCQVCNVGGQCCTPASFPGQRRGGEKGLVFTVCACAQSW